MNRIRLAALVLATASWLAACGGGDPDVPGSGSPSGAPTTPGTFTAVVSFGDSLSDAGTYSPATSLAGNGMAPFFGGRFTTNGGTAGTVWVEKLAASLGLVVTPAEMGFAGSSVPCPAAANPALANTCTAYGQGGALVTNPNGIGKSGGALTVPVVTQIANHLARFGGFHDNDLVFVWAGNNDVLVKFEEFAAAAAQIQADAATGLLTPDEANNALFAAQIEAQGAMKQAALELAALVRDGILGHGGRYVAVVNLPDSADTPLGQSIASPAARQVLSDLSANFNVWLTEGLTGQPVGLIDIRSVNKALIADPAAAGFTNVSVPACDAAAISAITGGQITSGSSLFCNATVGAPYYGLRAGADATTWLFADGVHPTSGGHAATAAAIRAALVALGWI
jgi:phospholipase/lecithinase/hemolysin